GDTRRIAKIARLEDDLSASDKPPSKEPLRSRTATPAENLPRSSRDAALESARVTEAVVEAAETVLAVAPTSASVDRIEVVATDTLDQPVPTMADPQTRDALRAPLVDETLRFLDSQSFLDRLWTKDPSLWKGDADSVRNRLGWLTAPTIMRAHTEDLRTFAD